MRRTRDLQCIRARTCVLDYGNAYVHLHTHAYTRVFIHTRLGWDRQRRCDWDYEPRCGACGIIGGIAYGDKSEDIDMTACTPIKKYDEVRVYT